MDVAFRFSYTKWLRISWRASSEFARVTVEIVPDRQGCVMTLTHERWPWEAVSGTERG